MEASAHGELHSDGHRKSRAFEELADLGATFILSQDRGVAVVENRLKTPSEAEVSRCIGWLVEEFARRLSVETESGYPRITDGLSKDVQQEIARIWHPLKMEARRKYSMDILKDVASLVSTGESPEVVVKSWSKCDLTLPAFHRKRAQVLSARNGRNTERLCVPPLCWIRVTLKA
jgi:hypothetical protein